MKIINLTGLPSPEKLSDIEIIQLPEKLNEELKELLIFEQTPVKYELVQRAKEITSLAQEFIKANCKSPILIMITGAPFLMSYLEKELTETNIPFVHAYAVPRVELSVNRDEGNIKSKLIFAIKGFIA